MRALSLAACMGLWAAFAFTGCFSPNYGDMAFACGQEEACPSGYSCKADGRCYRSGGPTGGADAAPIDGPVDGIDAAVADGSPNDGPSDPDSGAAKDGSPADGSPADGSPSDAADSDANCDPVSLLVDGNFDATENNNADWNQASTSMLALIYDNPLVPDSSPNYLWLGGYDGPGTDTMDQVVTIPADGGTITVSGVYGIGSPSQNDADDITAVEITNAAGDTVLETLHTWTGASDVSTWTAFTYTSSGTYGGQTIRIRLHMTLDSDMRTINFLYDSLVAVSESCVL